MNRILLAILALAGLSSAPAAARADGDGQWRLGLVFGEIPVLAGSFKPGLAVSYLRDENLSASFEIQAPDRLHRDGNSFNARNTGIDGLVSSRERTGVRACLALHWRPAKNVPHATIGVVFNGDDTETMVFDARKRRLGEGIHETGVAVELTRPRGAGPAVGLGWRADLDDDTGFRTGFAMALFGGIPEPVVTVATGRPLAPGDGGRLADDVREGFTRSFHNHYHLFTVGVDRRLP